jgi:dTMP kinase
MPVTHTIQERFIVLEGLDGAGTTTQMEMLDERLTRKGVHHTATFEPTDGPVGAFIRAVLSGKTPALPQTIALLFAADRNEHLYSAEGILARTARGELVVSDRYLFSSLAYQSIQCGLDYVLTLNSGFPLPQCLFFLDTPVEVCQRRLSRRTAGELFDGVEFQSRVREAYLDVLARYRNSGMCIEALEGDRPAREIHEKIWKVLSALPIS